MTTLKSYTYGPASGQSARQVVVLLHGLGADGRDLLGLAPEWARDLPDALFVSPDAPFPCDMAPFGRQWFSLQEWTPESILRGVRDATPILDAFLDEILAETGLPASSLALVGFSQGTMMSLFIGPRRAEKIAGILGYSGALVGGETLASEARHRPPVHLIHGAADMVVPVAAYYHARAALEGAGFPVSGGVSPFLPHSIDGQGISEGAAFLKKAFGI